MVRILMFLAIPLFGWAGLACLVGIRRFHYLPLAIPAVGYLSWTASLLLVLGVAGPPTIPTLITGSVLGLLGGICIVGYGLTFNPRMKALGITPKRILGIQRRTHPS